MRNYLKLLLVVGLLITGCSKEKNLENRDIDSSSIDLRKKSVEKRAYAPVSPADPSVDNSWSWYDDSNPMAFLADVYYQSPFNSLFHEQVALPWAHAGNKIGDDYRKEDGWVLYLRDFGSTIRPANPPFFALYNRYRGVLRFFVYNYLEKDGSLFQGTLKFNSSSVNSRGMLSFTADSDVNTYRNYSNSEQQVAISKVEGDNRWIVLDYSIAEYVASTLVTDELQLDIKAVQESYVNVLFGGDLQLTQNTVGTNTRSGRSFDKAIEKGHAISKSATDLAKTIETLFFPKNNSPAAQSLNTLTHSRTPLGVSDNPELVTPQAIPIIPILSFGTAVLGVIKSFSGSKSTPATTIKYSGIVNGNLTGNITTPSSGYSITFRINSNAPLSPSHHVVLFGESTGLFYIYDKADGYSSYTLYDYPDGYQWGSPRGFIRLGLYPDSDGFGISHNPNVAFYSTSPINNTANILVRYKTEYALVPNENLVQGYIPFVDRWELHSTHPVFREEVYNTTSNILYYKEPKVAVKITYSVPSASRFQEDLIFLKIVDFKNFSHVLN